MDSIVNGMHVLSSSPNQRLLQLAAEYFFYLLTF